MRLIQNNLEESIFKFLMTASMIIVLGGILSVVFIVFLRGISVLSIPMLMEAPQAGYYIGKGGGILNAILGSGFLAGGALMISLLLGLPAAMYLHQSMEKTRFKDYLRTSLDIASGIPTIVYGAVVFSIMVFLGARASLLWGMITIAVLILPIMIRAMDEIMMQVPHNIISAAYALGSSRVGMLAIAIRQSLPGVFTAVLLAFGRGIGDTASVLFTAGYSDSIPTSLFEPAATLPVTIFFLLGSPFPSVQDRAYAAGLVLLLIVLSVSITARMISRKLARYVVK